MKHHYETISILESPSTTGRVDHIAILRVISHEHGGTIGQPISCHRRNVLAYVSAPRHELFISLRIVVARVLPLKIRIGITFKLKRFDGTRT